MKADAEKQPLLPDIPEASKAQPASPPRRQNPLANLFGSATALIIVYYALCSSSMLVINKVTVHFLPAPGFVLSCQLGVAALTMRVCGSLGYLEVDHIEWVKFKRFVWVIIGFLGTIFCNIKVLQYSNVETFITFRSSTPIVLSLCDYFFLGRAWPNMRSWFCLLFLVLGAAGYVMVDSGFEIRAYFWLLMWYFFFVFDAVYAKHMCDSVPMTNWGRAYYTNALALVPLAMIMPLMNEQQVLLGLEWNLQVVGPLVLSCLIGICMSHASYLLREAVSATLFTVVGIVCKVLTVIINLLIWDKHADPEGIAFLSVCVLAGTFYQQAPKRT